MNNIKSVLFVCTGNSCRSIMAEGLLKRWLKEHGKDRIEVSSAGVRALDGIPPTDATVGVMQREGIDVSGFLSKRLTDDIIRGTDLVLAMENIHRDEIIRRVPEAAPKTHLLKKFGTNKNKGEFQESDVPDPIGRPIEDYEYCLSMIKDQVERIGKLL